MNYTKIESQMAPRTRRFMRELNGPDMHRDPEVRYWKRVSAVMCVSCMASFIALLVLAGAYVPTTPDGLQALTESVAIAEAP